MLWLSKFCVKNGRKYLPKSGSAVKLNEGALMVSVVFVFQISLHVYVCLGNKEEVKRKRTYQE